MKFSILTLFSALTAGSQASTSIVATKDIQQNRELQTYEIGDATVAYEPGSTGTDGPTLLVTFPHMLAVEAEVSFALTHYLGGCADEYPTDFPHDQADPVDISPVVTFDRETVVTYSALTLSQMTGLTTTTTVGGVEENAIDFCVRLTLVQTTSGSELGFRDADITLTYDVDDGLNNPTITVDPNTSTGEQDVGEYSAQASLCATDGDTAATSGSFPQGTLYGICIKPFRTPASGDIAGTDEVQIISVENFVFYVDANTDDVADATELQQFAVLSDAVADTATTGYVCSDTAVTDETVTDAPGCSFSTLLTSDFYVNSDTGVTLAGTQAIKSVGTVVMEFRGTGRRVLLEVGETFPKPVSMEMTAVVPVPERESTNPVTQFIGMIVGFLTSFVRFIFPF